MDARNKSRIAWALKCKPEDVPEDYKKLKEALDNRLLELKKAKAVKHG